MGPPNHRRLWKIGLLLGCTIACGAESIVSTPTFKRTQPNIEVALSFDELPYQVSRDGVPAVQDGLIQKQVTTALVTHLQSEQVPAMAFVHCSYLPPEQGLAGQWTQAGFEIGNQSSHRLDANTSTLQDWRDDIASCDTSLRKMKARGRKWFRFPQLRRGWTPDRDTQLQQTLIDLSLQAVPASIPLLDHLYNQVYESALSEGKPLLAESVVKEYIEHVKQGVISTEALAHRRRGMGVPHIARLHVNQLNADHIHRVIQALRALGVQFIPVHQAMQDPLYSEPNAYFGRANLSWINRVAPPVSSTQGSWFGSEGWRLAERYPKYLLDKGERSK